jgi:hypothetical protein
MKPDDLIRLRHIAEALNSAIGFVRGRSRSDILWTIATEAAPELLAQIKPLLEEN